VKSLARSKKKNKKSLSVNLKFELYGILLLIFSLITLFRLGPVGEWVAYIYRILVGNLEPVLSILLIFIAIYSLMIRRRWPAIISSKSVGFIFIFIALLTIFQDRFLPTSTATDSAGNMLSYTWSAITKPCVPIAVQESSAGESLFRTFFSIVDCSPQGFAFTADAGGGMIGGMIFALLFSLFGWTGARLLEFTLLAIGLLLITGWSYVVIGNSIRKLFKTIMTKLKEMIKGLIINLVEKRKVNTVPNSNTVSNSNTTSIQDSIDQPQVKITFQSPKPDNNELVFVDFQQKVHEQQQLNSPPQVNHEGKGMDMNEAKSNMQIIHYRNPYVLPPMHLLTKGKIGKSDDSADTLAKENAKKLESTLESFGVKAKVLQVVRGPAVTRYEIQPDIGVKVSRIVSLTDDIALALAAKDIRMEAPIPGKSAIGIEVPNTDVSVVSLREVMETTAFQESDSKLTIVLGRDISGQPIVANLAKMPHLLVAGATGSGKSVCVNGIITSILFKAKPNEVKFLMIDPKKVELNVYNGIPHLLAPVVTDPKRASLALKKVVVEMEKRYECFSKTGTRNIEGYNAQIMQKGNEPLPYIVVIVDELADLMMVAAGEVEDAICRLAQMARASGIHLIIATQRPSVDVITGVIKANIPSRIAFGVSSQIDSRTILDMAGAEKLLGRGDMLFMPVGATKSLRVQGAFLSDSEVEAVVTFCRDQEQVQYIEEMVPEISEPSSEQHEDLDKDFDQAVHVVLEAKQASVSLLQRRMRIGYSRAARLIDQMEAKGIVGPYEGSKPRDVMISLEQYQNSRLTS
jgi:S-DNA-T family DNA segregation ATPase FtsK/SpoIIIE